jgi:uncharacterized protein YutE (UPF0331/DUF86 family)
LVKPELIVSRLERLRDYMKTLKVIRAYDLERFKNDVFVHATAERYLQLAIECLLDIGNHIIADQGLRKPDTYAEILEILAENKIIPRNLYRELEGMAAFRNVLVHDYLRLDLGKVYSVLREKLPYLEKLASSFGRLL